MTDSINWVKERHSCTALCMFEKLRNEVKADIEQRNALRPEQAHYGFKFVQSDMAIFSVVREGNQIGRVVRFVLKGDTIIAETHDEEIFSAMLTLNDVGECRFKINGDERESWQLRKLALEPMFFEGL